MSLTIDDPETVAAIRRLASESRRSVDEVMREAVEIAEETRRRRDLRVKTRMAALEELQARFDRMPKSGLTVDKAFFDELGGDL